MCSLIRGNFTAKHNGPGPKKSKVKQLKIKIKKIKMKVKVKLKSKGDKFLTGQCFYRPYIGIAHRDSSFDK